VNKLNNVNVNYYLKITEKHRRPYKTLPRATCDPRVWDPDLHHDLLWRKNRSHKQMTFSTHKQIILS